MQLAAPTKLATTVHIQEVRELATTTTAGLCDPFVRVTVAGRFKSQTRIKHGQTSAVFDDKFSFPEVILTPDEYERAMIRVEVFTANTFSRNELVGQFAFSMSKVRSQPTHEFYQHWVVLTNPRYPGASQGYLRVSVTVLGPLDTPPSHPLAETLDDYSSFEALKQATRFGAESRNLVGAPATEKRRGYDFTCKIFRAEHLCVEADTFVAIKFNGVMGVTPVKKRSKAPDWNYRVNLPIFTPLYSDVVEVELWSSGGPATPDSLVATVFLKFSEIVASLYPPTWFNFYGVPPEETGLSQWWVDLTRKGKLQGTGYLGRILLSAQATLSEAPIMDDRPTAPINGGPTIRYAMWIDIIRGSELPVAFGSQLLVEARFGPGENARRSDWSSPETVNGEQVYSFTCSGPNAPVDGDYVTVEDEEDEDEDASDNVSICRFRPVDVILQQVTPEDGPRVTDQLYDLVINLYSKNLFGSETRVGFVRIKPVDVWGFKNDPEYHALKGYVEDATGFSKSQGFVLMSVQFGPWDERPKDRPRDNIPRLLRDLEAYELRAYLYQARNLPPVDADGLASSFVTVSLCGKTARLAHTHRYKEFEKNQPLMRSTTAAGTLSPVWYETLLIEDLQLPRKLALSPDIEVRVHSQGLNDYVGRARFPVELATTRYWPRRARARWLKLVKHDATQLRMPKQAGERSLLARPAPEGRALPRGDYDAGEILIKLEVMPKAKAARKPWYVRHDWPEVRAPPRSTNSRSQVRRVDVVVACVGLRGLDVEDVTCELSLPSLPDTRGMLAKARAKATARGAGSLAEEDKDDDSSDSEHSLDTWHASQIDRATVPTSSLAQRQETVLKFALELMKEEQGLDALVWTPDAPTPGRLGDLLPEERKLTLLKVAVLPVSMPVDPFYAPALTVRVLAKSGGAVLGSAVTPLRPHALWYGEYATKPKLVDEVFQLPEHALTREGKDQFEVRWVRVRRTR